MNDTYLVYDNFSNEVLPGTQHTEWTKLDDIVEDNHRRRRRRSVFTSERLRPPNSDFYGCDSSDSDTECMKAYKLKYKKLLKEKMKKNEIANTKGHSCRTVKRHMKMLQFHENALKMHLKAYDQHMCSDDESHRANKRRKITKDKCVQVRIPEEKPATPTENFQNHHSRSPNESLQIFNSDENRKTFVQNGNNINSDSWESDDVFRCRSKSIRIDRAYSVVPEVHSQNISSFPNHKKVSAPHSSVNQTQFPKRLSEQRNTYVASPRRHKISVIHEIPCNSTPKKLTSIKRAISTTRLNINKIQSPVRSPLQSPHDPSDKSCNLKKTAFFEDVDSSRTRSGRRTVKRDGTSPRRHKISVINEIPCNSTPKKLTSIKRAISTTRLNINKIQSPLHPQTRSSLRRSPIKKIGKHSNTLSYSCPKSVPDKILNVRVLLKPISASDGAPNNKEQSKSNDQPSALQSKIIMNLNTDDQNNRSNESSTLLPRLTAEVKENQPDNFLKPSTPRCIKKRPAKRQSESHQVNGASMLRTRDYVDESTVVSSLRRKANTHDNSSMISSSLSFNTTLFDDVDSSRTRSGRRTVKPLAFWKGERLSTYGDQVFLATRVDGSCENNSAINLPHKNQTINQPSAGDGQFSKHFKKQESRSSATSKKNSQSFQIANKKQKIKGNDSLDEIIRNATFDENNIDSNVRRKLFKRQTSKNEFSFSDAPTLSN